MSKLPIDPTITDVAKAYRFLSKRVRHTPTEYSYALSEIAEAPVYIKWENQQLCGSFKLRGALYKMNSLNEAERALGREWLLRPKSLVSPLKFLYPLFVPKRKNKPSSAEAENLSSWLFAQEIMISRSHRLITTRLKTT